MTTHQLNVFLFRWMYVSNSSFQACVSFDYWSENFALARASVSQCNTNSDKMSDSKHFSFLSFFFFNFHFIRNSITRSLLYHLFQFVDYNTLVCFNLFVTVFYDSYACLYVATRTLIIVHIISLYFVRFCINSYALYLSLSSIILVQADIFFSRFEFSQ